MHGLYKILMSDIRVEYPGLSEDQYFREARIYIESLFAVKMKEILIDVFTGDLDLDVMEANAAAADKGVARHLSTCDTRQEALLHIIRGHASLIPKYTELDIKLNEGLIKRFMSEAIEAIIEVKRMDLAIAKKRLAEYIGHRRLERAARKKVAFIENSIKTLKMIARGPKTLQEHEVFLATFI